MDIRPTSDRLRETLFDVLCAGNPAALEGKTWFDLYAGTGAVGIEALSRGAAEVVFVESSARAAALIRKNLQSLQVREGFRIIKADTTRALPRLEELGTTADYVFLDPPFRLEREYLRILEWLGHSRTLKQGGIVIAEHSSKFDPGSDFAQLRRYRKLKQGDAAISFYGP